MISQPIEPTLDLQIYSRYMHILHYITIWSHRIREHTMGGL